MPDDEIAAILAAILRIHEAPIWEPCDDSECRNETVVPAHVYRRSPCNACIASEMETTNDE